MATQFSKQAHLFSGLDSPSNRQSKRATKPSRKQAAADAAAADTDAGKNSNQTAANDNAEEGFSTRPSTTAQRFAKALESQEAQNCMKMQRQELARQDAWIKQEQANQQLNIQQQQAKQTAEQAAERDR